ncbi:MAG: response regulator transcription factor [Chloroflexi bacterium]|nr:response regulator transcription factor [Chloroflexota bacterium]
MLKLLLADDHALFREGLAGLLAHYNDIQVVGQAANGQEAFELASQLLPDAILMDIDMPVLDGLTATRLITTEMPYIKVVILTVHEDEDRLFEAIRNGAEGYLLKNVRPAEMIEMLRSMQAGEAPISRLMASRLLREFARQTKATDSNSTKPQQQIEPVSAKERSDQTKKADEPSLKATTLPSVSSPAQLNRVEGLSDLSGREREVLELVAQQATNKEIALKLNLSEFTVKNHLRNILAKLHMKNRFQAAQTLLDSERQHHPR